MLRLLQFEARDFKCAKDDHGRKCARMRVTDIEDTYVTNGYIWGYIESCDMLQVEPNRVSFWAMAYHPEYDCIMDIQGDCASFRDALHALNRALHDWQTK